MSDVSPDCLESALGIREMVVQTDLEEQVVTTRDDLSLWASHSPGPPSEPGPHGDVAVTREEWSHKGQQGLERRREVDVHVSNDLGIALSPSGAQGPTASFDIQVKGADSGHRGDQPRYLH